MWTILWLSLLDKLEREEENERNLPHRAIQRSLRDHSDPFSIPDTDFLNLFRCPKEMAHILIQELEPHRKAPVRNTAVPAFLKVLAALQFYGKGSHQSHIGQSHLLGMSQCTVSRSLHEVTTAINNVLGKYIKFPQTNEDILKIKCSFNEQFDFPNVLGVVDGTLITIVAPPRMDYDAHLFIDMNGCYSLNVLIICDADLRILSLNARYPGSVNDHEVWTMSSIRDYLEEKYAITPEVSWLIGDSGYLTEPWLLTPVQNAQPGSPEERYNTSLWRVRKCMKYCLGVLKGRFRCLQKERPLHYAPPIAGSIINACAALHNFLIDKGVPWDDPLHEADDEVENRVDEDDASLEAWLVRARVIKYYS